MQTTTLPIQSTAAQAAARTNANAGANADPSQFGAMLSQEIEQRQQPAPAPAAKPAEQPKPAQQADKPDEPKAATPEPAKAADGKPADKNEKSDSTAKADEDDGSAAEHPATAQVTDMLALVASLNQSLKKTTAAATPDKAAAALSGAKPGVEGAQLAALQSATRALGKDASDGVTAKATTTFEQIKNQALGLADAQAGKDAGAALGTLAKLKVQPETAAIGEARDTLAQAAALKEAAPNAQLLAQLQPASLAAAQLAAGVASDHIPARVGSSGWDQQVGQKIVLMAGDGEQSAELTLNPPDLGPLQVVLNVSNDQASVEFSSNQLEVRQALENALPRLREMMSESGIALGNATVNAGTQDQRQAQGDGQSGAGRGSSSSSRLDGAGTVTETATRTTRVTRIGDNGMVDTFA